MSAIDTAIDQLDADFQQAPLNFPVEQAIQARLLDLLRQQFDTPIRARAGYNEADTTNYKQKYLKRLAQPQTIDPVQAEVNIGEPGMNRRLDIAVLRPEEQPTYDSLDYLPPAEEPVLTVRLVDGTKYFPAPAIEHAIEIKYIKNVDIAGSRLERDSLDEWPYFGRDLDKLASLSAASSRHLLVCTNKNIFQLDEQDAHGTTKARRRFQRVSEECEQRDIQLTEIHPQP